MKKQIGKWDLYFTTAIILLICIFIFNFIFGVFVDSFSNTNWIACSKVNGKTMAAEYGLFGKNYCITYGELALEIKCTQKNMFWEIKTCVVKGLCT